MAHSLMTKQQFDILFSQSDDFVFFMEKNRKDFKYIYVNPAGREMLGADYSNKLVTEMTNPSIANTILDYYHLALDEKKQTQFQDYSYLDLEVKKHETTVIPVIRGDKQYVLAITKEITFDRDLQDKFLFMRSVYFNTFLSTVLISDQLDLLEANPQFIKDFDICVSEWRGKKFYDMPMIASESKNVVKQLLGSALQGEAFTSKMLVFYDKDGNKRHFASAINPLKKEDEIIAVFLILQEVTSYIHQQQALQNASQGFEMLREALGNVAAFTILDKEASILEVNDRFETMSGYRREELIGNSVQMLLSEANAEEYTNEIVGKAFEGEVWRGEICNKHKSGDLYWVDITIIPMRDLNGEIEKYFSIQFDITEKKEILQLLTEKEATFSMITENTHDLIVIMDLMGNIQYASPSYFNILGYNHEEIVSHNYVNLLEPSSARVWKQHLANFTMGQPSQMLELALLNKADQPVWMEANYTVVHDQSRQLNKIIMISRSIAERKELEDRLKFLAYHDSLTLLPNRRYLMKEFPSILVEADKNEEAVAVLFLDGDNFKLVNDRYGHEVGDEFLRNLARLLQDSIRTDDLVVRFGGDEFVIILRHLIKEEEVRIHQVEEIIHRIQSNLNLGWIIQGYDFIPTVSIGVAFYPEHAEHLTGLLDVADQALYEIKQKSKNGYKITSI